MRELTSRQREVLSFMRSFQVKHGLPPTVRELGERFRITPRAAFDHLRALERKGELQRRPSAGRTSRLFHKSDCAWVARIPEAERAYFKHVAEAREQGFTTCPVCEPWEPA